MTQTKFQTYKEILQQANPKLFASEKYQATGGSAEHFPTMAEVLAHLKLLKAFQVFKIKVVGNPVDLNPDGSFSEFTATQVKYWQTYLTNASRRFIIYMSALKYKFKQTDSFGNEEHQLNIFKEGPKARAVGNYLRKYIPPLDVLMIWHSFTLNPKSFYDNGVRNNFLEFTFCPFPLYKTSLVIDGDTFAFKALVANSNAFEELTRNFGIMLKYEYNFDMRMLFSIFCPVCGNILVTSVPLTNNKAQGFSDPDFAMEPNGRCNCHTESLQPITHATLRKRQLEADILRTGRPLPNVTKFCSNLLSIKNDRNMAHGIDQSMKKTGLLYSMFLMNSPDIKSFSNLLHGWSRNVSIEAKSPTAPTRIFRLYDCMNLIHLTIPQTTREVVEISEDLVACTVRQERFVTKMNSFNWLSSEIFLQQSVSESLKRYDRFFTLMSENLGKAMLVPTLDIDLVWHTHQLSPVYYLHYSRVRTPMIVIDHDDKVNELKISECFENTSRIYKTRYNEEYLVCFCWYCSVARKNSMPIVRSLFTNGALQPISALSSLKDARTNTNPSHILAHNAVKVIRNSRRTSTKTGKPYNIRERRGYPWNNSNAETVAVQAHGDLFSLHPIIEEEYLCPGVSNTQPTFLCKTGSDCFAD